VIVFLNGRFVPEAEAVISVFDRSFQYGDGLFETLRVANAEPFRWDQHLDRLTRGAEFLQITLPFDSHELRAALTELVRLNKTPEAALRIALSRGVGQRGYSPTGADQPALVMSLHPAHPLPKSPPQWKLFTSSLRLTGNDPLTRWKTSNKLVQVLARAEAERSGADEALLLNTGGDVCETSSGNLFWLEGSTLRTPPVDAGLLPGITRAVVLELAPQLGLTVAESRVRPGALTRAAGVFVTLSSWGIIEIVSLDHNALPTTTHTQTVYHAYQRALAEETACSP